MYRCLAVHLSTCEHHNSNNIFIMCSGMELTTWQAPGGQCWRTSTKPTSLCTASSSGQETWCGSMLELYTGFRPLVGATTLPGMLDLSMVRSAPSSDQIQIIPIQLWIYIYSYFFWFILHHCLMCICSLPVPAGPGEVWVEWSKEGQIHRPHDSCVLERGPHSQDHRPRHLQDDQVSTNFYNRQFVSHTQLKLIDSPAINPMFLFKLLLI